MRERLLWAEVKQERLMDRVVSASWEAGLSLVGLSLHRTPCDG